MLPSHPNAITVRRLELVWPDQIDPVLVDGQPALSNVIVALSLLMPYVEPYLIRTMRLALPRVSSREVAADMRSFCAQEGQHYRQHARFNEALRLTKSATLLALEAEVASDYARFTSSRSLRFNLAYAEGFEAFTSAFALYCFEVQFGQRMRDEVRELFEWHLMEELEHRTVTFDAYQQVSGSYLYRLFVGLFAQLHLVRFTFRASQALRAMRAGEAESGALASVPGREGDAAGDAAGAHTQTPQRRVRKRSLYREVARHLLPKVLATYLPWYTPHAIEVPPEVRARGPFYAARASSLSAT